MIPVHHTGGGRNHGKPPWSPCRVAASNILGRCWLHRLWIVGALLVLVAGLAQGSWLDFRLAELMYRLQDQNWTLRHDWLFEKVLHKGAQKAVLVFQVCMVLAALSSFAIPGLKRYRRPLIYLSLTLPIAAGLVSVGKAWTNMDCPYDLLRFGGDRPYVGLFSSRPAALPDGRCFPAGHASGGYGLVGLYFVGRHFGHRLRFLGLGVALLLGLIFGLTQQLRGAHFLSHDLWTLAISWMVCLLLARIVLTAPGRSGSRPPCGERRPAV